MDCSANRASLTRPQGVPPQFHSPFFILAPDLSFEYRTLSYDYRKITLRFPLFGTDADSPGVSLCQCISVILVCFLLPWISRTILAPLGKTQPRKRNEEAFLMSLIVMNLCRDNIYSRDMYLLVFGWSRNVLHACQYALDPMSGNCMTVTFKPETCHASIIFLATHVTLVGRHRFRNYNLITLSLFYKQLFQSRQYNHFAFYYFHLASRDW